METSSCYSTKNTPALRQLGLKQQQRNSVEVCARLRFVTLCRILQERVCSSMPLAARMACPPTERQRSGLWESQLWDEKAVCFAVLLSHSLSI